MTIGGDVVNLTCLFILNLGIVAVWDWKLWERGCGASLGLLRGEHLLSFILVHAVQILPIASCHQYHFP